MTGAMGYLSVSRAVSVRVLFASHGVISVWRLYDVTKDPKYWYLSGTLGLLFIESMVTVVKRQGKEWKWFCPSVFIYLLTSVPAIWFLEMHEFDKRIQHHARLVRYARANNLTVIPTDLPLDVHEDLSAPIGSVLGVRFEVRIPIKLTADQWIRMLEQMLLLILILGRWLLPKGKLTHDQLSQLLLVYIGTAADIVEFFEAFKEKEVRYHKVLCVVILGIWSLSLLQFSLVFTATRARPDKSRLYQRHEAPVRTRICHADVFGIVITILLQDLPFLVLRMLLIFRYSVLSYTNMFFTSKNTLVIVLLVYRLIVLFTERKRLKNKAKYSSIEDDDEEDDLSISETSVFRRTATLQNRLIKLYQAECHANGICTLPRHFYVQHEKPKWGRTYHFEEEERKYSR